MFNESKRFNIVAAAMFILSVGCAEPRPGGGDQTRTLARVSASDTAARELNVAIWQAEETDAGTFIVGTSAAGEVTVKVQVQQIDGSEDRVEIIGLVPETGRLTITRDGTMAGDASQRLRQIATRITAEFGVEGLGRRMPVPSDDNAQAPSALSLNDHKIAYEGNIDLGWSFFGYSYDTDPPLGGACKDGFSRTSYGTTVYAGTGNCYFTTWVSADPKDCRAIAHVGQRGWNTAKCIWDIYQNGIGF
jgi:hypothetical protein